MTCYMNSVFCGHKLDHMDSACGGGVPVRLSACGKFRISFLCSMRMLLLSAVVDGARRPRLYQIIGITQRILMHCILASSRFMVEEFSFSDMRPPRWSLMIRMLSTECEDAETDLFCVPTMHERISATLHQTQLHDVMTLRTRYFFIDRTNYSAGVLKRWWVRTRRVWRRRLLRPVAARALTIYARRNQFSLGDCLGLILDFAFPIR